MCESGPSSLTRLSQECANCLHQGEVQRGLDQHRLAGCEACRELAYRALCDDNDAAWDLLLGHLWPLILRWLYAAMPELAPALAQSYGYRALSHFRRYCTRRSGLATNFPTFPALLALLHRSVRRVIRHSRG